MLSSITALIVRACSGLIKMGLSLPAQRIWEVSNALPPITSLLLEWKRTVADAGYTYRTVNNVLQANSADKKYLYLDHLGAVGTIMGGV
ncbi:hypothetical protein [Cellvibrio sp. PSBB023]|uniref:hypothetical protein n=1 Tax=Cellvibrio sp. PSBB023 TaxID=1945512 RepID=UPI00098FBB79|nr:hypothetical protein [Cellvibrio sp. PSBB023]AQT59184.1 hypothetical protein B0D95_03090 [Cellvibrio sp. PSBB023]